MASESNTTPVTDGEGFPVGSHAEAPGDEHTRKRTSPEGPPESEEPHTKAMRWSTPEDPAGSQAHALEDSVEAGLCKQHAPVGSDEAVDAGTMDSSGSLLLPAPAPPASTTTEFLNASKGPPGQAPLSAEAQSRPAEQHDIAVSLQQSLAAALNASGQSHQDSSEPTNLALLLQLAAQSAQAAPQAPAPQPQPLQSTSTATLPPKDDQQQQQQQQQQDSLLSQLQLLLQLQQHLQQHQRQQQPTVQQLLHQQLQQLQQQPEAGDGEQEAMDPAVRDASTLLHQQLEQAAKEQQDAATKEQEGLVSQALDLQRVPPPLQLELPAQHASFSGMPASTPQVPPSPLLPPTQQLVQMLLALQSAHTGAGDAAPSAQSAQPQHPEESSAAAPHEQLSSSAKGDESADASMAGQEHDHPEGSHQQQPGQEGGDAAWGAGRAKAGLLAGTTEGQLLHLLERVGMQNSVEGRALLQAAGMQAQGAASAGPPGPAPGAQGAERTSDDGAQLAVATLCSLAAGQQAAAALAAASVVAADAAAAAAAGPGPETNLPPVSPLSRIHQPGAVPKRARTRKGARGPRGTASDDQDADGGMAEDLPAASGGCSPAAGSSAQATASFAAPTELPDQGAASPPIASPATAPHPNVLPASTQAAAAGHPSVGPPAGSMAAAASASATADTAAAAAAAASMVAALDQSVLPLLQQIAPLGVQQLSQEQREQAERMLLQLLPLLPLTASDGTHPELEAEAAAMAAAAAAASTQDPGARLVPSVSGPMAYGSVYDANRSAMQLPLQHDAMGMASPSAAAGTLSTITAGRGRRDQGPKRLLDFRLHVPHKFVDTHFPEQAFPLHTIADVYVNNETVREGASVKLYSTRNNTRKTGIGNFWLTGLQQTIKLYKDVKVSSISVAEIGEGQVKKFVLHLTAQGVWHEPPAFVKRGLGQTGDTTGNPAVKPYDGRIHVPLALMKQHFADIEAFPMVTSADMYLNGDLMAEGVVVRVVRYQKHKREGHYNYWITGHQKLVRSCNDLRVLCVEFLTEGRFKICFVAPQ